eukprot:TRINITY_DN4828_c0_g2_i1.p1 TRINITY_DN4828_c0_g2~~TRINITY_DN4828_c0_g2_i1.p1  ORF type:complete len:538 (+),score=90.67 TRINITY_DN4828_c0_g2_i1:153-1766(+)
MDATLNFSRGVMSPGGASHGSISPGGGGTWEPSWKWSSSLEDFGEFNPDATIGSPRSVAACDAQGILPRELRYKPLELFQLPGVDPRVAQLRYDFMENRRQDLLSAARSTRQAIIELAAEAERMDAKRPKGGRAPDLHTTLQPPWNEGGPPDPSLAGAPTTPYEQALGWFHEVLNTYSFSNAAASPPSSPMGTMSKFGDLEATLPPMSPPSPASPMSHIKKLQKEQRPVITRAASEGEIRGLLDRVRYAPRATRADEDMAKKSDDLQIVYPKLMAKWRKRANADTNRLTDRRIDMATETFDRLVIQDEEDYQSGKLREAMHAQCQEDDPTREVSPASPAAAQYPPMSPFGTMRSTCRSTLRASRALSASGTLHSTGSRMSFAERQDNAREKNLALKRDFEIHRQEAFQKSILDHQARKERLVADDLGTKWRVAQSLLEERVAWRAQYDKVATSLENHDQFKRDYYQKRDEQQRAQRDRVGDSSEMRKEIRHLRDVNRMLNMVQRDRKEAWRHAKKQRESMEKKMSASGVKTTISKLY